MFRCLACSAPLRPNNPNCEYCGVRNPLDLLQHQHVKQVASKTERICPECNIPLNQIDLNLNGRPFYIEQCPTCFGLFFDNQELEQVLDHQTQLNQAINKELIDQVNIDRHQSHRPVKYRKCPVCLAFMSRRSYAYKSGVIVDRCAEHGIWLDNGELAHLIEWRLSGGKALKESRPPTPHSKDKPSAALMASAYTGTKSRSKNAFETPVSSILEAVFNAIFR